MASGSRGCGVSETVASRPGTTSILALHSGRDLDRPARPLGAPRLTRAAPGSGGLVDRHGRVATDLRVSLTDRCNLRCTYCMPPEGLDWLPKVEVLTDEEIVRLVRIGVEQLGIREVRFTGGEPLLRPGLVGIVAAATALRPGPEVSLTTNAIGLARVAPALAAAGLDRINCSLDTRRPGPVQAAHPPRPAGRRPRRARPRRRPPG